MNPILQLLGCLAVFLGLVFGLGLPFVASWRLTPTEKICVGAAVGVVLLYLFMLVHYWWNLPFATYGLAPFAALVLLGVRRYACAAVLRDPAARRLLASYLLVAGWSLGFLALVRNYSGGGWALDWADHYSRALFFLHHQPPHSPLFGGDHLPTRPPLANAVTAVFLAVTSADFPFFQIFSTLASSLAFLPVWLFAGRFSRNAPRAQAVLTVLFLLNPSVLENSTFAWTKLITVFFVLTGVYFFLPALAAGSRRRLAAAFLFLAAGLLAHYSAGPYAVAIVAAYFWWRRSRWSKRAFWAEAVICALPAAVLLATWFGWSLREFGVGGTFLSNTSVAESTAHSFSGFVHEKSLNLVHTLVPHFLRSVDYGFIAQHSRLGYLRDYFFLLYQVNLPLVFGSVGGLTLLWLLWREWRKTGPIPGWTPRCFWLWFVSCTIVLGASAYGGIDQWGVTHPCLQSLLGLGLALLAARLDDLPRWWRTAFVAGLCTDFILGVGLQFHLEDSFLPPLEIVHSGTNRLVGASSGASLWADSQHLNYASASTSQWGTWVNLSAKIRQDYTFVGDWPIPRPLLIALLACLLLLVVYRCMINSAETPGAAATIPATPDSQPSPRP